MIFRQGGQGPCAGMVLVSEFVLLVCLVLAGSSCSTKVVSSRTPVFSQDSQNSSVPAAQCVLPRPDTHPKVNYSFMPPQADMGALVSQTEGEPASGSSDFDDSAFSFEEVEDVPSISDIVLAQYDDWRGVRYRSGGEDFNGVDCSGLVRAIFRDAFEIELPRTSEEQSRMGEAVPRGQIRPGDLVYFVDRGRDHVGVVVNDGQFLHASSKKGVIVSKLDGYWQKRLLRVRRVLP